MKSQASFELMILVTFLIAISIGVILLFQSQFITFGTISQTKVGDVCANIADKINAAYSYGFGYEQNTTLPSSIENQNYTITVTNQTVVCIAGESSSIENLLTNNIRNTTSNQPFQIPIKQIKISNVEGTVVIS